MSAQTELETMKSPQRDFFSSETTDTPRGACAAASLRGAVSLKKARTKAPRAARQKRASGDDDLTVYRLFRRSSSPGVSGKNWAIGISDEGTIRIRLGLTGGTARLEEWPTTFFTDANAEIEKRTSARLTQGYELVGDAVVKRGRLELKVAGEPTA